MSADPNQVEATLVYFTEPLRIPLPGLASYEDVQYLSTGDHGLRFFGTLTLRIDLQTRILSAHMEAGPNHLSVHVPLEHVASFVPCT